MLSFDSHLALEPLFCKSTGAYRSQVARFCQLEPRMSESFKLTKAQKPMLVDADSWQEGVPGSTLLKINQDVIVRQGVRSTLDRTQGDVTLMIHPSKHVMVEFENFPVLGEDRSWSVEALSACHRESFSSLAIALIRHGIFDCADETTFKSSRPTLNFKAENYIEVLQVEGRILIRNLLSGRIIDLTDSLFLVELLQSREVFQAEPKSAERLLQLCRLGLLRQII